jgi:hypothetical protein
MKIVTSAFAVILVAIVGCGASADPEPTEEETAGKSEEGLTCQGASQMCGLNGAITYPACCAGYYCYAIKYNSHICKRI